jgi:hypothetical protein
MMNSKIFNKKITTIKIKFNYLKRLWKVTLKILNKFYLLIAKKTHLIILNILMQIKLKKY